VFLTSPSPNDFDGGRSLAWLEMKMMISRTSKVVIPCRSCLWQYRRTLKYSSRPPQFRGPRRVFLLFISEKGAC
jgi:hypothetical protein